MPDITAKSWNRFVTEKFFVNAELMGSEHEFDYEKHHITVRLPKTEDADRDETYDEIAYAISNHPDTKEPLIFTITKVDIEIEIPYLVSVPEEALTNPSNQIDHFTKEQQKIADSLCETHSSIAERAFDYWLEIIRWSSENAMIGQPSISGVKSGWGTYILDTSTNKRVWSGANIISVHKLSAVTEEHWTIAAERLKNGIEPPMHLRFLHDAESSAKNGHYEKSILESAMACEIYLRYSVFEYIPENTPQELIAYIEEANINKYSSRFFKSLVSDAHKNDYKKLAKEISSLMSRRNSYVHMGRMKNADIENCYRFINSMKSLFNIQLDTKQKALRGPITY
jgi:HEPN domain-containing protein